LNYIKNRRSGRDATDAAVKPDTIAMLLGAIFLILHRHPVAIERDRFRCNCWCNRNRKRWQCQYKQEHRKEQVTKHWGPLALLRLYLNMEYHDHTPPARTSIQIAMPIMPRFSASEIKPSGTLLPPPTQAHFSSRLSI
jgi:hypothetical protein